MERITLTTDGGVATATLQRPDQLNPIDHLTLTEILAALDRVEADDDLRVLIVTGTGRAFSAGGDIKEMETDTEESFRETTALYQELARRVALFGHIEDGHVQYHPDWPEVRNLSGFISVGGRDVRIAVSKGVSFTETDLSGSHIHLKDNASVADINLVSTTTVAEALTFIRTTPLKEWMSFVTPATT